MIVKTADDRINRVQCKEKADETNEATSYAFCTVVRKRLRSIEHVQVVANVRLAQLSAEARITRLIKQ